MLSRDTQLSYLRPLSLFRYKNGLPLPASAVRDVLLICIEERSYTRGVLASAT
jgi:hypothetical protein